MLAAAGCVHTAVIKGGGVVLQCGTLVRAGTAAFSGGPGLATLTER